MTGYDVTDETMLNVTIKREPTKYEGNLHALMANEMMHPPIPPNIPDRSCPKPWPNASRLLLPLVLVISSMISRVRRDSKRSIAAAVAETGQKVAMVYLFSGNMGSLYSLDTQTDKGKAPATLSKSATVFVL